MILVSAIILFLIPLIIPETIQSQDPDPVFNISLLTPNTNPMRIQWSNLIELELAKIGINVSYNDMTGWTNISTRTWAYPVGVNYSYIPTYDEGGYDILFVGWGWGLDWDPTGLYDTASIVLAGDNFYQFSNPDYDSFHNDYLTSSNPTQRISSLMEMQAVLDFELPSIPLVYGKELLGIRDSISGIDTTLIVSTSHRSEFWVDSIDNTIIYALPAEFSEYNTFVQESHFDGLWMQCVYGTLFARAQGSRIMEPSIATGMTVSTDKMQFNVSINPDAKFSNGDPVLAEDVKYTYELHMTPSVGSGDYWYLAQYFVSNDSIVVIDDSTIQFNLNQPYPLVEQLFSYQIIDKSTVEPYFLAQGTAIFNMVPVVTPEGTALVTSCGPFMLSDFDTVTSTATLVPNPFWHGIAPSLNQLIFTFIGDKTSAIADLADGTIDIVDCNYVLNYLDFEGISGVLPLLAPGFGHQEMALNMKHPIFGTGELTPKGTEAAARYVRQAISHIIPRQTIVDTIMEGLGAPAGTITPEGCVCHHEGIKPDIYDVELAKKYMEMAGYSMGLPIVTETVTDTITDTVTETESVNVTYTETFTTTETTTITNTTASVGSIGLLIVSFLGITSIIFLKKFRK